MARMTRMRMRERQEDGGRVPAFQSRRCFRFCLKVYDQPFRPSSPRLLEPGQFWRIYLRRKNSLYNYIIKLHWDHGSWFRLEHTFKYTFWQRQFARNFPRFDLGACD